MRQAIDEFHGWGQGEARETDLFMESFLALILVDAGDVASARACVERCTDPGGAGDNAVYLRHAELEVLLGERRGVEALAAVDAFAARFPHFVNPSVVPVGTLRARALAMLGRRDEAVAAARAEVELAATCAGVRARARALRVLGTLLGDDGLPELEEAVRVVEGSVARLEHGRSLAALGGTLRRARRPADAREPLRHALELADACGAKGLVESVRAELAAAGARPRTTAASGVEALTASERRVVQHAVEGSTNRDIAQALFVTPKTVEVHLSNAYRKLGVRSRHELQAALQAG
jgi:DNA-binding NarL/FixJ family response regulator